MEEFMLSPEERLLLLEDEAKASSIATEQEEVFVEYKEAPRILEQAKKHRGRPMGFASLDTILDGVCSGELIVITATPGTGKTVMCQSITRHLALAGNAVLWYTLEVTLENFLRPLVQHDAGAVYEVDKLLKVSDLPIYFPANMEKVDFATLKRVIRQANIRYGVEHVFIDHLHYLLDSKSLLSSKNTSLFIGDRLRQLRQIAIETGVSIFLVAHMTKVADGEKPTMSHMRDSSFLAGEADAVLVLWRDRLKTPIKKTVDGVQFLETFSPLTMCAVEKSRRTGQKGIIKLRWEKGLYFEATEAEAQALEIAAEIKS